MTTSHSSQQATFGGGCFWCLEAIFQQLDGVESVQSGYAGGETATPNYQQVCNGQTGHAEVIQITFNPAIISYQQLLELFFEAHDPTTLNRQGNDIGTQYRSVIFSHNDEQKQLAETSKQQQNDSNLQHSQPPVVTEITALDQFFTAEEYHNNYYQTHQTEPYCNLVIGPKLKKLKTLISKLNGG